MNIMKIFIVLATASGRRLLRAACQVRPRGGIDMSVKLLALAAAAAMALPCVAAQATPIRADFGAVFLPPNPCNETDLGDLTGAVLSGGFELYYRYTRGGDLIRATPGAPAVGNIACGARAVTGFDLALGDGGEATLYLSFAGQLVTVNPGPAQLPVYAFSPFLPNPGPPELPDAAPLIELGVISLERSPGPIQMPLFAFASPGHEIGYALANVSVVPEPARAALLAIGLAAIVGVRRLARRQAEAASAA